MGEENENEDYELLKEKIRARETALATQEVKEVSAVAVDVNKTLETKLNSKLASMIDTDEEVNKQVAEVSKALVTQGADTLKEKVDTENLKAKKDKQKAKFELSESKWRAFGQKQLPEKDWQLKMIEFGSDLWFIIKYIVCLLFFAPFYFFADMIDSQKGSLKVIMIIISWILLLGVLGSVIVLILHFAGRL